MIRFVFAAIVVVVAACSPDKPRTSVHLKSIDSIISVHVNLLSEGRHRLEKRAAIGSDSSSVVLSPDSIGWERELAVFRQLDIAERPNNRDKYVVTDREDANSNLRVLSFEAKDASDKQHTPVPFIRYYYLGKPSDVRRIESEYYETNPLYTSKRDLVMEFEDLDGLATLRRYQVEGFQKIRMADSVHFSVAGEVVF